MCQANVKMYSEGLTFNSFPLCYMCYKYDMARYIDKKWKLLLQMTVGIYRTVFSIATTCIMCILRSQTCSVLLLLLSRCFVSESFVTLIYTLLNKLLWKNKTTPCTDSHLTSSNYTLTIVFFIYFLAFDFCRFCVVIRVFHPRHNGQWPPTSKDFLSQILSITFIFLS